MRQQVLKWLKFSLRWGIAVVGIWLVIRQMSIYDRVWVIQNGELVSVRLWQDVPANPEPGQRFRVYDGTKDGRLVEWDETANKAEVKTVELGAGPRGSATAKLVGLDLRGDLNKKPNLERLYVVDEKGGRWIKPDALARPYVLHVPYPRVETGLLHMARDANPWLLILSIMIFPITFVMTSVRWHELLKVLEIKLPLGRAFVLNMVGAFYNTFMPGSTGGDVLKAYYASKQTSHRTRAVISVVIDRAIGLVTLVIMGGTMAGYQYFMGGPQDPAAHACGKIALFSLVIVLGTVAGLAVLYIPVLRRVTGFDWILGRLPKQKQIRNAMQTMELYRSRKWLVIAAIVATFPVHITVVLSAMFASQAFGLHISPLYYFVAVPVIVLVGAIPISPQGAGVMEYFAILLVGRQGGTVSQAFALTMSIRMVQILWNLTGGIFVFRGGYHQPTAAEQRGLSEEGGAVAA